MGISVGHQLDKNLYSEECSKLHTRLWWPATFSAPTSHKSLRSHILTFLVLCVHRVYWEAVSHCGLETWLLRTADYSNGISKTAVKINGTELPQLHNIYTTRSKTSLRTTATHPIFCSCSLRLVTWVLDHTPSISEDFIQQAEVVEQQQCYHIHHTFLFYNM